MTFMASSPPRANGSHSDGLRPIIEQDHDPNAEGFVGDTFEAKLRELAKSQGPLQPPAKMVHLKKRDGEPMWRFDIQYDFLNAIFTDETRAFVNPYTGDTGLTFADIYIDSMARSSKCSRILSEKLLGNRRTGIGIAMICLLVNLGRMNTTLNFFPEMKAQLRTYHPIPSLQSKGADDKQLQDAPRLKSILKGACEDREEPRTLTQVARSDKRPPTNAINMIFLLANNSVEVEHSFVDPPGSIFDLVMDHTKSSTSRARSFLWIVWTYLETSLRPEQIMKNPFGNSMKMPPLVQLTKEEWEKENVDTQSEKAFGEHMTLQRIRYLESTGNPSAAAAAMSRRLLKAEATSTSSQSPALKVPAPNHARGRRVLEEFRGLLREKRARQRRRRLQSKTSVARTWEFIRDLDPLYDSDAEVEPRHYTKPPPSIQAVGLADGVGDLGEYARSMSRAISIANKEASQVYGLEK